MTPEITVLDRLLEVSELFQKDMARAFAGTPLTPSRVRVLWDLAANGPSTQHALAARLEVSPRNVTGLVDALEAGGYVLRSPHPHDRRAIVVSLEPSAATLMANMQQEHADLTADLLGAVAPGDRAALERGITAIAERLRDLVAEAADGPAGAS
ncbi:MarR family winged helix-turn-helix transcriptional regulator [Agromyces sp. S2-1-8]|uniref:MarR family winged helix-turn-helix transcriptional regulator n=1 Tax=Agromyces sp. S2-1-8 TaxID=2897180 RepID=UPI001E5D5421|nr:MarR family transcriptional regulator [Agromyces sp. S2-1-8]MCD5347414.1 MarR family transcriptional regulator [Agromyces sp. S2-1-8]